MFDDKINRILGPGHMRPMNARPAMSGVNPIMITESIKKILDRMPEVKSATGTLTLKLGDGTVKKIQVSYADM